LPRAYAFIHDYRLEDATHPLEEADIKRADDVLKNDPFIRRHKEWQDALNQMIKLGVRVEQQAVAKHGLNFVLDTYLPDKLKKARFLPWREPVAVDATLGRAAPTSESG
jgi:DNA topoisomerase-6 subunit A